MIQTLLVALCALSLVSAGPHGSNGLSARRRHHFRAVRKSAPVAADPLGGSKTGEKRDCEEGAWQCLGAELQREPANPRHHLEATNIRLQLRCLGTDCQLYRRQHCLLVSRRFAPFKERLSPTDPFVSTCSALCGPSIAARPKGCRFLAIIALFTNRTELALTMKI